MYGRSPVQKSDIKVVGIEAAGEKERVQRRERSRKADKVIH
jgi:hypothetical protein